MNPHPWWPLSIDELIIRSLQDRTTPAEEDALRVWRQESLQNERHYRAQARAWRLAALIEPRSVVPAPVTITSPQRAGFAGSAERLLRRRPSALVAAAAVAALLIAAGAALLGQLRPDAAGFAAQEFVTGPGERVTTRLSDGTVVRLAPSSRLRVGDAERRREVWLDGQAFFAVARDDARRFVVRTRAGDATVLGTRFDVRVEEDGMQVFVVEGRVAHQAGGHEVQVEAMEVSRTTGGGIPSVEPIDDPEALLSWLGEFLVFQTTPIREVARELQRRYGVPVRVADPAVAERTVTAWFTNESLEHVLLIVCRAADARCQIGENTISIEP